MSEQGETDTPRFIGLFYDNLTPWRGVGNAAGFQIVPAPFPWVSTVFVLAAIVAFFLWWTYLVAHHAEGDDKQWGIAAGGMICVFTCVCLVAVVTFRFRRAAWQGVLLRFDRGTELVTLPLEKKTFPASRVRLQWLYLTGLQPQHAGGSELQLFVKPEGGEGGETFLLATSIAGGAHWPGCKGVFEEIVEQASRWTTMEVVRIAMASRERVLDGAARELAG